VGILQFGPDPTIDQARQGVVDALAEAGYVHGEQVDLEFDHGDGDYAATQEIARRFANEPKDLIIALTTPGLQAAIATGTTAPVVFTAVYDPYRAGAAVSAENHLATVCGVSSFPPVAETLSLARELVPDVTRIGTIRHPAEVCSASSLRMGRQVCEAMGIELVEILVDSPAEVGPAAELLAEQGIDLFYITGDNTVLLNFKALVDVARKRQVPLMINDNDLCPRGASVSMGFNFYRSGQAGGRMAARVLAGEDPASIPIEAVVVQELWVNPSEARRQGLELPKAVVARASKVVGE
jgi:putative ABC transport system substrate-binding protein